ncbi:polyprenyl diphosphate synthase [Candidatus Pelagibacter sp. HIMB1517]|uniref:polyprenyl diphosphate synthase n=1 Tax=Candidatus Pelagibacter sp. HIMB1517 TaxID=3413341 RepID=UPI003F84A130
MKNPNHIAIIMDGNGRWGIKKFKSRLLGHKEGVKKIGQIINYCLKNKIKNLTLYVLSRDNFLKRKSKELKNIFFLIETYLPKNEDFFLKNKINLNFIGESNGLPKNIKKLIEITNKKFSFKSNNLILNVALNYSSKLEIINTIKKINLKKDKITKKNIEKYLYTFSSGDPDLIIRTGGYNRLSDFLLWQSAYSEIYFVNDLWPEFKINNLKRIIEKFNKTQKNYGS